MRKYGDLGMKSMNTANNTGKAMQIPIIKINILIDIVTIQTLLQNINFSIINVFKCFKYYEIEF